MHYLLKRQLHPSFLIAWLGLGLLAGVFMAQFISHEQSVLYLILGIIVGSIGFIKRYILLVPPIIVGGMTVGLWRGSSYIGQIDEYKNYIGQTITIEGSVSDDVTFDTAGLQNIPLSSVVIVNHQLAGKVEVSISSAQTIKRGDRVIVQGKLTDGFGTYAAMMYRADLRGVIPGNDIAVKVRDWFTTGVRNSIKEPEVSLGIGFLVGQKSALPADLVSALQVAGLTHVVVASGYNLTILVRLARRLFMRISKYVAAFGSLILVACFMTVTGLSPSMTRAGLVTGLGLAAWYYGRKFHPLVLLSFAAAITVLIQPSYAWNDLGWALSFSSFAGVMILAPLLQRYFFGDKKPGTVRQILGETVAAHVVTAPLIILAFGQLSNVALFNNLLILPFVPLAMLLTFIAGIVSLIVPSIASFVGLPAQWLLDYMVTVTHWFADLPWAQAILHLSWVVIVAVYAGIVGIILYLWRATKANLREVNIVE